MESMGLSEMSQLTDVQVGSQPEAGQPFFTIFVPTYNRAHTLPRLLDSIASQSFSDLELLIVDDGSTDETQSLLQHYQKRVPINMRLYYQPNQGPHVAFNKALGEAKGFLFIFIGSDDFFAPNALERFHYWWNFGIEHVSENIRGVEALCADMHTQKILGTLFPKSPMVSDHVEIYYKYKCWGDAIRAVRTDIMARYRFIEIPGERFVPASYLLNQLGFERHQLLYVNEVLAYVEYRADGTTRNLTRARVQSSQGVSLYYHRFLREAVRDGRVPPSSLMRAAANWVRFSLHSNSSFLSTFTNTWKEIPNRAHWLPAAILGTLLWFRDRRHLTQMDKEWKSKRVSS
jgi:glycosyltransferase involved in cell wall biosynthesis